MVDAFVFAIDDACPHPYVNGVIPNMGNSLFQVQVVLSLFDLCFNGAGTLLCNPDELIPRLTSINQQCVLVVCRLELCCPRWSYENDVPAHAGLLYSELART